MGPSGSGKSTFLNLVGALDRPSSGQILIDGVDLAALDDDGLAQLRNEKIGFVFQAYNLINRSKILRNVELPALVQGLPTNERLMRTHDLLTRVGIDHMADRRPKTLSGGEQQRVAISRALVNNPQIVLADEPTGNLDSTIGSEIISYLKTTSSVKGTTMIIVTHNPEIAEIADRIVYFRDGKIVREVNRS
jgi:putative ABC transport system ATP-binding protein